MAIVRYRGECLRLDLDCKHHVYTDMPIQGVPTIVEGQEVDCPVCAEVKAARVEGLKEARKLAEDHTWAGVPGGAQAVMDTIDKRIAELEAE